MIENNLQKTEITNNINLPSLSTEAESFLCRIAAPLLIAGSEFLATKFRLATFNTICEFASNYTEKSNIEIKPTPPKFLLPFIEKASLEDDTYLQKEWAKLLVAAGKQYNPLQLQYTDILSKISKDEANLLRELYEYQSKDKFGQHFRSRAEGLLEEYETMRNIAQTVNEINANLKVGEFEDLGGGGYVLHHRAGSPEIQIDVNFPDKPVLEDFLFEVDYGIYNKNNLKILERLDLIKVFYDSNSDLVALTEFGYQFLGELEV